MARRPPRGFSNWSAYNRWRVRRGIERGLTPAQACGHPGRGQARASEVEREVVILGRDGPVEVTVVGVQELTRAGKLDWDVRELLANRLDARSFDRKWAGRTVGGQVVPDARRVQVLGRAGQAGFTDFYPRRGSS